MVTRLAALNSYNIHIPGLQSFMQRLVKFIYVYNTTADFTRVQTVLVIEKYLLHGRRGSNNANN